MNIFFVIKKREEDGGGMELVTAPLTRGDILPGKKTYIEILGIAEFIF